MSIDNQTYPISDNEPGQVITFYSYKGGTGRSMALANVASLLAQRQVDGKDVLMVDWDLEAPGLHRFFRDRLGPQITGAEDLDLALDSQPGLINLFAELYECHARKHPSVGATLQSVALAHSRICREARSTVSVCAGRLSDRNH